MEGGEKEAALSLKGDIENGEEAYEICSGCHSNRRYEDGSVVAGATALTSAVANWGASTVGSANPGSHPVGVDINGDNPQGHRPLGGHPAHELDIGVAGAQAVVDVHRAHDTACGPRQHHQGGRVGPARPTTHDGCTRRRESTPGKQPIGRVHVGVTATCIRSIHCSARCRTTAASR